MRKVCIVHKVTTLDPRSFYKQGRSLHNSGYEIVLLGLYEGQKLTGGIRSVGFGPTRSRLVRFLVTNYQIFRCAVREKAHIYHFHDLDFVPWAVLLKMITGAKVIYDIHEAHPEYMLLKRYIPKVLRKPLSIAVRIMEQSAVRFFDAIVPNDNFISSDFRHRRNVVIFNFPTLDFFRNANGVSWHERTYDLFYHGSLPRYHFETMMDVAAKLNTKKVRNIWGIVTNDRDTVAWGQQELEKRDLSGNFSFLPYTDYLSVADYLRNARIGIIPLPPYKKFMKNIPLKMFEFMGCGMPMVLSDLPPSGQFINGQGCAIAVEPENVEAYAEAIRFLLDNPDKAEEMGKKGQRLVFERFNWTSEGSKLLDLYNVLVDEGSGSGGKQ